MGRFPKPCIKCGVLSSGGSYCAEHLKEKKGRYNDPVYKKLREHIRATATHCHLCGKAFTDRKEITADHIRAGDKNSPLAPAHLSCNSRRGDKPL